MSTNIVRICNGALDEHDDHIVLRGSLDPETLKFLLVDDYQREIQPVTTLSKIMKGYEQGCAVPDIELGMRGSKKIVRDGCYNLHDPVYIIDGQQRTEAAKLYFTKGLLPHLGATVHFNSTKEWERRQFKILNADRTRVASNVLFRNDKEEVIAVKMLYDLSNERDFVLGGKVCWEQRNKRGQLLSAMLLGKISSILHAHLTGMISTSMGASDLSVRVQKAYDLVGRNTMRSNVKTFFEVLDECWGLRRVFFTEKATFIKATFLLTLSRILSNHEVFWRENRLFMDVDLKKKLASFPMQDPSVIQLACAGSKVDSYLYKLIVDHLNHGKRTRHLRERHAVLVDEEVGDDTAESGDNLGGAGTTES